MPVVQTESLYASQQVQFLTCHPVGGEEWEVEPIVNVVSMCSAMISKLPPCPEALKAENEINAMGIVTAYLD